MSEEQLNLEKQIAHWKDGALSAWDDALYLIQGKRIMLGLFAVHLSLEKALKAHVVKRTGKIPPQIHNLTRLAEIAELELSVKHRQVLAEVNDFNI